MRTLDEVLEAIKTKSGLKLSSRRKDDRWVVPIDLFQEIIYYLKEYQRDKQIFSYDVAKRNLELSERNEPLRWDELKTMTGQPVWVEEENLPSQWYLIDEVETDEDDDPEFVSMNVYDCQGDYLFYKNNIGTKWQAYRKERK